jgi:hypothetical protein
MFFYAHSGVRYLVLLAGLLAFAYALFGTVTGRPYDRTMFRLATTFTAVTHFQVVLGLALLLSRPFSGALVGHIVSMVFAAVVATVVPAVMRRREPEARTYLPHVVAILVALALMVMGIMAIGRSPFAMTAR